MKDPTVLRVLPTAVLGLCLTTCGVDLDFEDPPPTEVVWDAYDNPTLVLSDLVGADAVDAAVEQVGQYAEFCGWTEEGLTSCPPDQEGCIRCLGLARILGALSDFAEVADFDEDGEGEVEFGSGGQGAKVGTIEANLGCPGDGRLRVITEFTLRGFGPVVWGLAQDCPVRVGDDDVELTGAFRMEAPERFRRFRDIRGWVRLEFGARWLGDVQGAGIADIRFEPGTGDVQIRFSTTSGDGVAQLGTERLGVIDAVGRWACDLGAGSCQLDDLTFSF